MKRGPHQRENKLLSKKGLLAVIQAFFKTFDKPQEGKRRGPTGIIRISDCLMSALAMFNLKSPSLLAFDNAIQEESLGVNLKTLYGIDHAPSDTYLREVLDDINQKEVRACFLDVFNKLQRGNALERYNFFDGYLVAIDGTGVFESEKVHCQNCCEKNHTNGRKTYYHQVLAGAVVKPGLAQVIPLCPEPINKQDGATKNDCEINAANRFLNDLRQEHPRLKVTCTFDALFANAPFVNGLIARKFNYIIVAKPGNNPSLFEWLQGIKLNETQTSIEKNTYKFRHINRIPLNNSEGAPEVNFFSCEVTEVDGKKMVTKNFSWITSHKITESKLLNLMHGGRAKWKIENETFNTLKNQGYQFEHNFGHGKKNLHTVFVLLMMLSFLLDQAQEATDGLFQIALKKVKTRRALWEKIRNLFNSFIINSWEQLFQAVAFGFKATQLKSNTS